MSSLREGGESLWYVQVLLVHRLENETTYIIQSVLPWYKMKNLPTKVIWSKETHFSKNFPIFDIDQHMKILNSWKETPWGLEVNIIFKQNFL